MRAHLRWPAFLARWDPRLFLLVVVVLAAALAMSINWMLESQAKQTPPAYTTCTISTTDSGGC